jgi:endonuclease YncB( thermonuclease family)
LPEGFHLVPARFLRVHDGDTIVVSVDSKHGLGDKDIWVRMRGIDAPESNPNTDKFEREYDHFNGSQRQMLALGKRSTDKLIDLLNNEDSMSLICEPVDRGAKPYLHHRQYRLLAYLFGKNGNDIGRELIEFGFAVVWPRNIPSRKYLHPKTDGYIQACNIARNNSEGLWGRGLEYLCPATKETKGSITLDKCIECCHPNKKNIT